MADFKCKHETIQAMQVTDGDFETIYNWAHSLNSVVNKTDSSFVLNGSGESFLVKKGSNVWVIRLSFQEWLVVTDKRMQQLFTTV